MRQALGGGVGAVRGGEGIVDVDSRRLRGDRLGELGVVLLLARARSACSRGWRYRPARRMPIDCSTTAPGNLGNEHDLAAEHRCSAPDDQRQRHGSSRARPWAGRSGRAAGRSRPCRRVRAIVGSGGAHARVVGDRAVLHRQVEVDADQRDLAGHVIRRSSRVLKVAHSSILISSPTDTMPPSDHLRSRRRPASRAVAPALRPGMQFLHPVAGIDLDCDLEHQRRRRCASDTPVSRGRPRPSTRRFARRSHHGKASCSPTSRHRLQPNPRLRSATPAAAAFRRCDRLRRRTPALTRDAGQPSRSALAARYGARCRRSGPSQPSLAIAAGGVDHAVREAPFVVVPADDADQLAFDHGRFEAVDGRAVPDRG